MSWAEVALCISREVARALHPERWLADTAHLRCWHLDITCPCDQYEIRPSSRHRANVAGLACGGISRHADDAYSAFAVVPPRLVHG